MKAYFEHLEKAGLVKRGKVQINAIANAPFDKVLDLLDHVASDTTQLAERYQSSGHSHCASLTLGGGRDECWGFPCRSKAVEEMARFAALYSDRVFIHNFLSDFSPAFGHLPEKDSDDFRQGVADDITLLLMMRPLIEKGLIVVYTPPLTRCPMCYAKEIFGLDAERRLQRASKDLARDLFDHMSVELSYDGDEYELHLSTSKDVFNHENRYESYYDPPAVLASKPRLMNRVLSGETLALSIDNRRKLGIHKRLADDILYSLRYQMSVSEVIGTSYLTSRGIDLDILNSISNSDKVDPRNKIAAQHLQSIVPFAGDVPVSKLIELRRREEESFVRFRSALDVALNEMALQKGSFTGRDAQLLYADVIAPELAKLNQKVQEAKRDLIKVPLTSAIAATAVIAFGLYSGMVPAELKEIASVLGLTKIVYDTIAKAGNYVDAEKEIRPDKFYFLWKVKHLKNRAAHAI